MKDFGSNTFCFLDAESYPTGNTQKFQTNSKKKKKKPEGILTLIITDEYFKRYVLILLQVFSLFSL
jgi:hypothetical protein